MRNIELKIYQFRSVFPFGHIDLKCEDLSAAAPRPSDIANSDSGCQELYV